MADNSSPSPKSDAAPGRPSGPPPLADRLPEPAPAKPARVAGSRPYPPVKRPRATMEQEAEAEKHLRQANLLRMRGELKQSLEELVKAIDANPYDPAPHSLSADILRNVGRPDDAVKEYEIAKELSAPGAAQAAIEAKLARLVIEQNELNGGDVNALGISPPPLYRSGISTVIASAIVPGLGQMIVGQHVKAALLFLAWIAPTAVFFMPNGPKIHFGQTVQPVIFFLGTIGAASWLASIIDSVAEIKRAQSTKAER